jgi:hypothetical protein
MSNKLEALFDAVIVKPQEVEEKMRLISSFTDSQTEGSVSDRYPYVFCDRVCVTRIAQHCLNCAESAAFVRINADVGRLAVCAQRESGTARCVAIFPRPKEVDGSRCRTLVLD